MPPSGHGDAERAQSLLEEGASLYEEGKLYDAISCWRQVLVIDPHNEIAAEYLRFIEDNFQIGIDAFLEHHSEDVAPAQALLDSPDNVIEQAIEESIDDVIDESIEELDWSELLEDGPETTSVPPPIPQEVGGDEAFFADLEPGSLEAAPGAEAEAWGAGDGEDEDEALSQSLEVMPEGDPFTLPRSRFSVDYEPGEFAPDHERSPADSSVDSIELNLGELDDGLGSNEHVVTGPKRRHRLHSEPAPRKDLADMSEESIDKVLEEDFKAWEGLTSEGPADVPFDSARPQPIEANEIPDPFAALAEDALELDGEVFDSLAEPAAEDGSADPDSERPRSAAARDRDAPGSTPPSSTAPLVNLEPDRDRPAKPAGPASTPAIAASEPARPTRREPSTPPMPAANPIPTPPTATPPAARDHRRVTPAYGSAAAPSSPPAPVPDKPPAPAPESRSAAPPAPPAPETDLDDALRAILTAGIAAIDAVEARPKKAQPRRLIEPPPPGTDLDQLMREARRRQQADDFSGAISLVEQVLAAEPNHAEARSYLEQNTDRLLAMYRSRLGSLGRVPRVRLRQQEIVWQSLDHREGFILSQVDGRTTFEEIIDISGMTELQASRILARLVEHGVIG